jgi:tRNA G18 (ribose-2'-O)-methylase SpoU
MACSPEDPELAPYRSLYGSREATHPGRGPCFICEGRFLVVEALAAGRAGTLDVVSVLANPKAARDLRPLLPASTLLLEVDEAFLQDWLGFPFHRGVLCCVASPPPPDEAVILAARRLLVLPRLDNVDNLGQLLRTAAALGVDAVLAGKGPTLFDRRTVRVSMGAVWRIPVLRLEDPAPLLRRWRQGEQETDRPRQEAPDPGPMDRRRTDPEAGRSEIIGAALVEGALDARDWHPAERSALVLGPEPHGLEDDWLAICDRHVVIPMVNSMDSLNVGAAGAILTARLTGRL